MSQTNVTTEEIAAMLETGRKPDTAGQRTWPNWKVAAALTTTAETERLRALVQQLGENAAEAAKEYAANMKALRAEVERLRGALEWRPIETAPRDGSLVDLRAGPIVNLGCVWENTTKGGRWVIMKGDCYPTITPYWWRQPATAQQGGDA